MFAELSKVMDHAIADDAYIHSLNQNIANKRTKNNQEKTSAYLKQFFGFDINYLPFRFFKYFWEMTTDKEKPVLTLLYAIGEDYLLMESQPIISSTKIGEKVTIKKIERYHTNSTEFRKRLPETKKFNMVSTLGSGSFKTPMWDFTIMWLSIANLKPADDDFIVGIDATISETPEGKEELLQKRQHSIINQTKQKLNPNNRILFSTITHFDLLEKYANLQRGIVSGDKDLWFRCFWEVYPLISNWRFLQSTFQTTDYFGGKQQIINWTSKGIGMLRPGLDNSSYGKQGVVISQMGVFPASIYLGELYDNNTGTIVPKNQEHLAAINSFCSSHKYVEEVRKVDQALKVTNASLVKVPFVLQYWQNVVAESYPNGLPQPYSDDLTQWLFHGHPVTSTNPLQIVAARILGYRWPAEDNAELGLADDARELINQIQTFDDIKDEDGILCIPQVNGELAASESLRSYLWAVYSSEWSNNTVGQLLQKEGATASSLDDWLRTSFFEQHCKLFKNRPFIWHIWDGRKDGFSVLVNYHKINTGALQRLIFTYLGGGIRQCEAKRKSRESGAEGLLSAALKLKEKLETILEGEAPYDIFVRWKPLEQQLIGWEPDLNDGVRLNIRPFIIADVLRKKPNIKWGVDRGNNPSVSFWGEIRDNEKHLSLEEKRKARKK